MSDPSPPETRTPLSRVLVPLDGSPIAESALRAGFAIAQRARAQVTLLRAVAPEESEPSCTDYLHRMGERFARVAAFDVAVTRGQPADVLLDAAATSSGLLCMASRGRGGVSRMIFGSVAEAVLRRSASPVVVVGPEAASLPLLSETAWLLFCTDGSDAAALAVPAAAWLAQSLDLGIVVVQGIGPDENVSLDPEIPPPTPVRDAATHTCEQVRKLLSDHGVNAAAQVLFGDAVRFHQLPRQNTPGFLPLPGHPGPNRSRPVHDRQHRRWSGTARAMPGAHRGTRRQLRVARVTVSQDRLLRLRLTERVRNDVVHGVVVRSPVEGVRARRWVCVVTAAVEPHSPHVVERAVTPTGFNEVERQLDMDDWLVACPDCGDTVGRSGNNLHRAKSTACR